MMLFTGCVDSVEEGAKPQISSVAASYQMLSSECSESRNNNID